MSSADFEQALHQLEAAAMSFGARIIRTADVRTYYFTEIAKMSKEIKQAVITGKMTHERGAAIANYMRNVIMRTAREFDFDLGRSYASRLKNQGLSLDAAIEKAMINYWHDGKLLQELPGHQQRDVLMEVVESSGRSRTEVTSKIPKLRMVGKVCILATIGIAIWNIGTAENPWWQVGREGANIAGGVVGGIAGGAASGAGIGALTGAPAGPVGVGAGVLIGGAVGAIFFDHLYVETAGTSDTLTRDFIARFTGVFTGVDEAGLAKALASEKSDDIEFTFRVLQSLDRDYTTDVDDIALEYIRLAMNDSQLLEKIKQDQPLCDLLVELLEDGWTSDEESKAIDFIKASKDKVA